MLTGALDSGSAHPSGCFRLPANHRAQQRLSPGSRAHRGSWGTATGTPEKNGLHPEQALSIINALGKEFKITSADIAEIAPFINTGNNSQDQTLEISAEISKALISAMTKTKENIATAQVKL